MAAAGLAEPPGGALVELDKYDTAGYHDEMFGPDGKPRPGAADLAKVLRGFDREEWRRRQRAADMAFVNLGITFTVYGENASQERIFPFDLVPRIVGREEWLRIEAGLAQRVRALNAFIDDVYHEKRIVKEGVVPESVILSSAGYLTPCEGASPPRGIWCHVSGIDLVRDGDGTLYVLEDNVRCPSGVSYVLENRQIAQKALPELFAHTDIAPVSDYPIQLLEMLQHLSDRSDPRVVVLTPGRYNSAYFEHSYLAQKMGVDLVENGDLVVQDGFVMMRTTRGFERVDVIYTRVNTEYLDPEVFRSESLLGVPGIFEVWKAGNVALANAPGTGVADDKGVYPYVPDIIRFYLDEEPILQNVPTYRCWHDDEREHVLSNLDKLVVKSANESGGYGMLIGPHATEGERAQFAARIRADPRNYVAQPTLTLSRVPTFVDDKLEGRHVDLRPYVLFGRDVWVLQGGLTRVALRKGSLVVNSSQGGGSKDTWVLSRGAP